MLWKVMPIVFAWPTLENRFKDNVICFMQIILSSALLALSFSSFNLSYLAWVALIPLFFALKDVSLKQAFILSYICGGLFFLLSMYWLINVTSAGWVLLSLYQGLYIGIFGVFFLLVTRRMRHIQRHNMIHYMPFIIIPAVWSALEYMRSNIAGGIGWNLLGYSQYEQLTVIQIADITGVYGVSFLIVVVNMTVFEIMNIVNNKVKEKAEKKAEEKVEEKVTTKTGLLFKIIAVLSVITGVIFYGNTRLTRFADCENLSQSIKASLVQGNISQMHKWDERYKDYILRQYAGLTQNVLEEKPDIIIWPETAVPGYLNKDIKLMNYIQQIVKGAGIPLFTGVPMAGSLPYDTEGSEFNSALMFSKTGDIVKRYDKLHLVIFGEYIPLEKYIPGIRNFFPITGNFTPGDTYTVFNLSEAGSALDAKFGCLICFEDIFPYLVRRFVIKGADFVVNVTNDAWFGKTAAAYQHAANSVFRAVENRRSVVRSANTGLTCFIDRTGRIYNRLASGARSLFVEGHITDNVSIYSDNYLTFYTKYGDIFALFCLFITGCFVIDYTCYRKYNK
jgi:apolipoprotein N-acyltransferase